MEEEMRSLVIWMSVYFLSCGGQSHETTVPVRSGTVPSGSVQTENATGLPCGVRAEFIFVNARLVRVRVHNDNTRAIKVVLKNRRTGVEAIVCVDKESENSASAQADGSFGDIGDQLFGEISLQSVPGARFFCLPGSRDGFDVCSGWMVTLIPAS